MNMKIEKYEKIGTSKYRLYLDNGEVIDTYDNVILKNELLTKKTLDQDTYNKIFTDNIIEEKYNMAVKYISIRISSKQEIIEYLKRKNTNKDTIEEIVLLLEKNKLLNDEIFTQAFINDKLKFTTMGSYKIINELKKHQISDDIINKYSNIMSDNILKEKIIKLIDKQIKTNNKKDNTYIKNKLYNKLINLGYPASLTIDILNSYFTK